MHLTAEFTTEPFVGEGEVPDHARAALAAAEAAGLQCEFGPLGTTVRGEGDDVVHALADVLRASLAHGATRVTVQVERAGGRDEEELDDEQDGEQDPDA